MKHPFIVLEGLSGVGKTTVGKILAERLGGLYYHTPPDPFNQIREQVDRHGDPFVRYLFYLSSVRYASLQIQLLRQTTPIICDRYILTTQCYFRALGVPVADVEQLRLEKPDLTVLLTCEKTERHARLDRRGRNLNDLEEECVSTRFEAEYLLSPDLFAVDTTQKDPGEVADIILQALRS